MPFVVLGVGLLAISFGAIFARFAQGYGLPSLAVAALRLGLAALIVTPLAWWQSRQALRALDGAEGLDLRAVDALDSAGLALLSALAERLAARGATPRIDGEPPGLAGMRAAYRMTPHLLRSQGSA